MTETSSSGSVSANTPSDAIASSSAIAVPNPMRRSHRLTVRE